MQKAGLKINSEKSHFGINEVEYLGYVVTREGVKPNPKKVKTIMELQRPTTTTEVRRVIGPIPQRSVGKEISYTGTVD